MVTGGQEPENGERWRQRDAVVHRLHIDVVVGIFLERFVIAAERLQGGAVVGDNALRRAGIRLYRCTQQYRLKY